MTASRCFSNLSIYCLYRRRFFCLLRSCRAVSAFSIARRASKSVTNVRSGIDTNRTHNQRRGCLLKFLFSVQTAIAHQSLRFLDGEQVRVVARDQFWKYNMSPPYDASTLRRTRCPRCCTRYRCQCSCVKCKHSRLLLFARVVAGRLACAASSLLRRDRLVSPRKLCCAQNDATPSITKAESTHT